jgi:hypothetical protein
VTTSEESQADYRARIYADNIAMFEALVLGIERLHSVAPTYSEVIAKQLSAGLKDLRAQGKEITARALRSFDEEAEDRRKALQQAAQSGASQLELEKRKLDLEGRRLQVVEVEAARVNRQRWFVLGQSLLILLTGNGLAIWILLAGDGTVTAASAGVVASLATGGGALTLVRGAAHGK